MGGTCYAMGLMLAYNQFSGNSALLNYNTSTLPGRLRQRRRRRRPRRAHRRSSSSRPTATPTRPPQANFVNGGANNSYYQIRYNQASPSTSEYPNNVNGYSDNDPTLVSQILSLVNQLAAQTSAQGYSTPSKPLLLHCIAFGPQIDAAGLEHAQPDADGGQRHRRPGNTLPSLQDHQRQRQHLCFDPAERPLPRSCRTESRCR